MRMQTCPAGGALTDTGAPESPNVVSTFCSRFPIE
jgi:hypothetical protein